MKAESTADILELMQGGVVSAVVGVAMEFGLFWRLAEKAMTAREVAQTLNIPLNRCQHWLQILCRLGLLEDSSEGYAPSSVAREAILNAQSQESWFFRAREERDSALLVRDLAVNIGKPMASWRIRGVTPTDYFQQINEDANYAAQFTRKLYEIHVFLAEQLAKMLDLRGVKSVLDLGGGSGVVSMALLRKYPELTAVVVDAENVCKEGREIASREIAAENGLAERITYLAADFLQDKLPGGFDLVMLCDVGVFSESLLRRIYDLLNPEGKLVIVDKFAPSRSSPPPSRLYPAFLDALLTPAEAIGFTTAEDVQIQLQGVGFGELAVRAVPHEDSLQWNMDWSMVEARK